MTICNFPKEKIRNKKVREIRIVIKQRKMNIARKTSNRFAAGKLVMFSRKNKSMLDIIYFLITDLPGGPSRNKEAWGGRMKRGEPFFLAKDPVYVPKKSIKIYYKSYLPESYSRENYCWEVTFLLNEKIYIMYLTDKIYNHELVKASSKRLEKTYK